MREENKNINGNVDVADEKLICKLVKNPKFEEKIRRNLFYLATIERKLRWLSFNTIKYGKKVSVK